MASDRVAMTLPPSLKAELQGDIAELNLNRPEKRTALDEDIVARMYAK